MGLFDKLKEPVLFKDSDEMTKQMEFLKELQEKASGESRRLIEKDMRLLEYGRQGEEAVLFELMNSFMPMIILRDLHLQYEGLSAQIDFAVITRKVIFIIECKNLFGDLSVNEKGDFIRTLSFKGIKTREGIYSPVTQNKRHLDILKAIKISNQSSLIRRTMVEKYFHENHQSIIVLANNKTILSAGKADKDLRNQIIRNDQLITHMKKQIALSKNDASSDKTMTEQAGNLLKYHKPLERDYTAKYRIDLEKKEEEKPEDTGATPEKESRDWNGNETAGMAEEKAQCGEHELLYERLKEYRLKKSREEGSKAYYLFTNAMLEELLEKRPKSLESLRQVSGFGELKVSRYGEDLIRILNEEA